MESRPTTQSPLFERLTEALTDSIAHERGERTLRRTTVVVPPPPKAYASEDIKRLRAALNMNQTAFAALLRVSAKTVESWEQGVRSPRPSAARLLQFIENPGLLQDLHGR